MKTLIFSVSCAVAFVVGYCFSQCTFQERLPRPRGKPISERYLNKAIRYTNLFLGLQIALGLYALSVAGWNYSAIFNLKMSMSFLYETRIFALLLLSFVYFNTPPEKWFNEKRLRLTAILLAMYFVVSLCMQSRSVVFECAVVIGCPWLMWHGNKIRIKYVVISLCAMFVPNLVALPRFGSNLDWQTKIAGIFSFEYTVIMSNVLSSAIASNHPPLWGDFFWAIPSLLIPSPLRNLLGTGITSVAGADYYMFVVEDADVLAGGFSLLAEMYMNLGWWGILMFVFLGLLIGKFIKGAARVGRVDLLYAAAPLMYSQFIIALRNNFATFAKYSIQLILVAMIMKYVLKLGGFHVPVHQTRDKDFRGLTLKLESRHKLFPTDISFED